MVLKSLQIKNFRALEDFSVEKLGRVNLIVGRNNSGKSSILEALRIYADGGRQALLRELADMHDEPFERSDKNGDVALGLPFESFFTGRKFLKDNKAISIGQIDDLHSTLELEFGLMATEEIEAELNGEKKKILRGRLLSDEEKSNDLYLSLIEFTPVLSVNEGGKSPIYTRIDNQTANSIELRKAIKNCAFVPTTLISQDDLAATWDKIGLTDDKSIVADAMRIVAPEFQELMFVKNNNSVRNSQNDRTAIVKLSNSERPVPLKSMGDGMSRILQLSLKMFAAKGGFLLIDEFENGLHYSVQEKVWEMLFWMAEKLDMQVFATTHSWDCVESFAKVARQRAEDEGILLRVGRSKRTSDNGKITATVLNGQQLFDLTQADMEVR